MASKREELEAELAALEKEERAAKSRFEVEIGQDGNYARVPYEQAKAWLKRTFGDGFDLDAEPVQDEPEAKDAKDDKGGKTVRFGRQVG